MLLLPLIIDITTGNLLVSLSGSAVKPASSISLNIGDSVMMQLFLVQPVLAPASAVAPQYQNIGTAGYLPELFISDGTLTGTYGMATNPYTQQIVWTPDPTGSFFSAIVPLNTANLKTLIGSNASAKAVMTIGFYQDGYPTTFFTETITFGVGIPGAPVNVPVPQTPLSLQVANMTYFPIQPVPGQALYLESLGGKILELVYVDNGDGSATFQQNPQN